MLSVIMLNVIKLSVIYAECHLCRLSQTNGPIMLSVIKPNVIYAHCHYAECHKQTHYAEWH